ncbi:MAG: tol-pal system protein YbgF [Pseudomonadota bacterium]
MRALRFVFLALVIAAPTAYAQEDTSALVDRLNRLERDVNFVQKQVYRGDSGGSDALPANAGQLQVRLSQVDEEIRQLHGQLEQAQFQNKQNADQIKKLSDDVDYRLRAIEQKQAEASAQQAAAIAAASAAAATPVATAEAPAAAEKAANYQPEPAVAKPALTGKDFPNANAHYAAAFKLLNDKKYSDAAASFDTFVKKYPSDPLTSNAYYWLGESQYARSDFTRSAESFRKGFEVNPEGQKAPDNLYKLALSLNQIKRTSEACIVLGQVISKYSETAARTAARAGDARTTMQCK